MEQIKVILSVERTPASNLRGMMRVSMTEVILPAGIPWTEVEIKPHASLTITDKQEDKATVWTARLTFKTCETFADRARYAYRCRLPGGQYRLIGSDERPFPVASVTESMPENVADNQLNEVTVTWQSPRFIPYIRG